jgi:hypothetical protein
MAKTSADERRSGRANVMLAAALELEGVRIPVRVANLSSHGALILGTALPPQWVVDRRLDFVGSANPGRNSIRRADRAERGASTGTGSLPGNCQGFAGN